MTTDVTQPQVEPATLKAAIQAPTPKSDILRSRADPVRVLMGLAPYVWPEGRSDLKRRVAAAFVLLVMAKMVTVGVPIIYKAATDWLAGASALSTAAQFTLAGAMLIVAYGVGRILMSLFTQSRDVLFTQVTANAVRGLTLKTFEHMHRLSLRFHLERRTGGLNRVIQRGTNAIELIIRMGVLNTVPTVFELLFIVALLWISFGWLLVLVVLTMVVVYIWFSVVASEWRISIRREMNESDTDANTKAIDSLLNYETVKYFGNEGLEARRFDQSMARYENASVRAYYSLGVLNGGQAVIFTLGLTLAMLIAAHGVVAKSHTIGDFVMINALLIQLYIPLNFMGMIYREIKQGIVDLETMFSLLDENPEIKDKPGAKPLQVKGGAIRFDNVRFSYEPEREILKGVSLEVPAGKMVAIVGPSGAGKSTLSRILFRFYDISEGRVTIDGQDIREVTQDSLRAAIGVVPQDTVLFNDTVHYNIRYGRPTASEEEVIGAARLAQIDAFIQSLPQGYKSMVGERGLKLSGGEKQRVAIARTILKSPPILLLDEATSALDSHTEKEIQDALDRVAKNRTTLVIAHRLSTIVHADQIVVMDKGEIAERGSHAELIEMGGLYASMWERQRAAERAREELAIALEKEAELQGERIKAGRL
ncbi:MAG: ABC transporter ATP-binding protein/permease [Hyphomicrobiaceae bacterium]|nr:MAG: ABC transporter ATP-binding protein/permease [Hyphomicrobiaceae bacterium]